MQWTRNFRGLKYPLAWIAVIFIILIADGGIASFMGWSLNLRDAPRNSRMLVESSTYTSLPSYVNYRECSNIDLAMRNIMRCKGAVYWPIDH